MSKDLEACELVTILLIPPGNVRNLSQRTGNPISVEELPKTGELCIPEKSL